MQLMSRQSPADQELHATARRKYITPRLRPVIDIFMYLTNLFQGCVHGHSIDSVIDSVDCDRFDQRLIMMCRIMQPSLCSHSLLRLHSNYCEDDWVGRGIPHISQ